MRWPIRLPADLARYKALAEELGLTVTRDPRIGWAVTTLREGTAAAYAPTINALQDAITLHRRSEPDPHRRGGSNLLVAVCQCPRRIRVAPGTLAAGPIVCAVCDALFEPL